MTDSGRQLEFGWKLCTYAPCVSIKAIVFDRKEASPGKRTRHLRGLGCFISTWRDCGWCALGIVFDPITVQGTY